MTAPEKAARFISLIDGHKGIIHKIANAYGKSNETRKDLVQEIILQLWKAFERYDPTYRFSTWVYKVALNVSLAHFRKESKRARVFGALDDDLLIGPATEPAADSDDDFRHLERFIRELKALDRAILLLYLDEKSQKEMAEIMGFTETNISTRIGRIKAILKQKFTRVRQ